MALDNRVEVLFDKENYSYLEHLAKRDKTSVGKLHPRGGGNRVSGKRGR